VWGEVVVDEGRIDDFHPAVVAGSQSSLDGGLRSGVIAQPQGVMEIVRNDQRTVVASHIDRGTPGQGLDFVQKSLGKIRGIHIRGGQNDVG